MVAVLIVDDEALVANALRRELRRLGLLARVLTDPSQTEAVIAQEHPRMIVCDLWMPGRSGTQVLASVKALFPDIRRCLLSGSLFHLQREELAPIEPCTLLSKPWTREGLLEFVEADLSIA